MTEQEEAEVLSVMHERFGVDRSVTEAIESRKTLYERAVQNWTEHYGEEPNDLIKQQFQQEVETLNYTLEEWKKAIDNEKNNVSEA